MASRQSRRLARTELARPGKKQKALKELKKTLAVDGLIRREHQPLKLVILLLNLLRTPSRSP